MKRLSFADMRKLGADQNGFIQSLVPSYPNGLIPLSAFGYKFYFVYGPEIIRELLVKNGQKTDRDPFTSEVTSRAGGYGLFSSNGEPWKKQRKMVQPAFHATRIQAYVDTMVTNTEQVLAAWQPGKPVHLTEEMTGLALKNITQTMFGVELEADANRIGALFDIMMEVAEAQFGIGLPPPRWLPTPANRKQKKAKAEVSEILLRIIQERRQVGEDTGDLLSMLLFSEDENGEGLSDLELLDQCLTMFFAGHETTASLMSWAMYQLLQAPDILARLKSEIETVIGDGPIQSAHIRQMPFLEAETLRLYPPAPGFGRVAKEPFWLGDTEIRKGTMLFVQVFVLHRLDKLYTDPDHFNPDRFLDEEQKPGRYDFIPFGGGQRICVGNMFAMLEASIALVTLIQQRDLQLLNQDPVEMEVKVTIRPKEPIMVDILP